MDAGLLIFSMLDCRLLTGGTIHVWYSCQENSFSEFCRYGFAFSRAEIALDVLRQQQVDTEIILMISLARLPVEGTVNLFETFFTRCMEELHEFSVV